MLKEKRNKFEGSSGKPDGRLCRALNDSFANG